RARLAGAEAGRRYHGVGRGQGQRLAVGTDALDREAAVVRERPIGARRAGQPNGLAGREAVAGPVADVAAGDRVAGAVAGEHEAGEAPLAADRDLLADRESGVAGIGAVPGVGVAAGQAV